MRPSTMLAPLLQRCAACAGLVDVLVRQNQIEPAHDMLAKVYNMQLEQAQLSQEDPAVLATTARSAAIMLVEHKHADAVQCYQSVRCLDGCMHSIAGCSKGPAEPYHSVRRSRVCGKMGSVLLCFRSRLHN